MQSQEDALYNYARSIIRATPKREHARPSRNAESDIDSLSLLLNWGAEEKCESVSDEAADDPFIRDAGSLESDSALDEGIDKTWEVKKMLKFLILLVACALMMVLLLRGVVSDAYVRTH